MKVCVAESAGFCMGVRKAMDCVVEAAQGNEITFTLGPLIHNPQALKMLEYRNVYIAGDIDETLSGKTVVTRAHGITVHTRKRLNEVGALVVDATCPKVLRSQALIKKYNAQGYKVIIVGDIGHAEVNALLSYTDGTGTVIETVEETTNLPHMGKVCVVAQTTFNNEQYKRIAGEISKQAEECYVAGTVCAATERRQADIPKLAKITDATVVVGGKNSANTCRLAEISRDLGQPTYHVEDPTELDMKELLQYNEIGVTAGASTPSWVIKQVVDSITGYTPDPHRSLVGFLMSIAFFAIEGNFVICAAAAALTYAMSRLMSIPPELVFSLMSFFYLFPLHTINKYLEINWKQISSEQQVNKLKGYWRIYLTIGFISFLISLLIAWYSSLLTFSLVAISYILGGLYSVRVIPESWKIRFKSLRDIPGSKDVMTATAWTFAVIILPAITYGVSPGFVPILMGSAFVFVLVFSRMTIHAIGDIQSDKLVGLETIPVLIGRENTLRLLYTATVLLAVAFSILTVIGHLRFSVLIFLIPVFYLLACIKFLSQKGSYFTLYHEVTLDAVFFLTGFLALLFLR
ncbi:4-hydroxy-3-methylbut-2-enyl diphosphate reductase [Candidatus Latescibacterota bacterium]